MTFELRRICNLTEKLPKLKTFHFRNDETKSGSRIEAVELNSSEKNAVL
ncbi:uncharacterized protein G2W53_034281 [Senna tora]|uniref:Uncharacterized protein n=1 Tax=Senna tora TaxID=362788 RepID=A0A834W7L8_9FABA|nr:uncharacterized protein G2W53_034281 [Senna tora]